MAKGGRPKKFNSPEMLLETFYKYRDQTKASPIKRVVKGNKGFVVSDEDLERPLTLEGFENYCFINGIINDLGDYFKNKDNAYTEFSPICALIKRIIREDQITGGMAGIYNPSITQRLNGLVDKQETAVTIPQVSKEDLLEIVAKINS